MPANYMSVEDKAKYFKLRKFEFNKNNKFVKEPCFTRWDKENGNEIYVSNNFGGDYLYKLSIGEPKTVIGKKTGQEFILQDIFFEFHSQSPEGGVLREIVVINRDSSLLESIIGRLLSLDTFDNISFYTGSFFSKEIGKNIDFVTIYQKGLKINSIIGVKKKDKETGEYINYPDNFIFLPDKKYIDVKKKTIVDGKATMVDSKQIDPNWSAKKDEIYDVAIETLKDKIEKYIAKVKPEFTTPINTPEKPLEADDISGVFTDEELETEMPF